MHKSLAEQDFTEVAKCFTVCSSSFPSLGNVCAGTQLVGRWEPSRFLLVPSPFVFVYFVYCSNLALHSSEADKVHMWWITITKCFVFVAVSFVAAVRSGVAMSKNTDLRIVVNGLGLLVPIPDRLAGSIYDFGFFVIISKTLIYQV